MERLAFDLESASVPTSRGPAVVVGVVASGNLEVLVESGEDPGRCHVEIATSAQGFGEIWKAVLEEFASRHAVAGLSLSVNDAGATPAVVTLRLAQAVEEYLAKP
jgi:malonate decarboxylase delta subunit